VGRRKKGKKDTEEEGRGHTGIAICGGLRVVVQLAQRTLRRVAVW